MIKKQQVLEIIRSLEFESSLLQKILDMIDAVEGDMLPDDIVSEIQTLMLEEEERALGAAVTILGMDVANDPAMKAFDDEYDKEVADIKVEFDRDMTELNAAMDQLEEADKELGGVEDEVKVAELTSAIKGS